MQLLRRLSDQSPLNAEHTTLLLGWMGGTSGRLDGDLPHGVKVAHKSGTSDVDNGLAAATNDIGLIALPNGQRLAIAVFVTDSTADDATRLKIIARIGRVVYDAAAAMN